MESGNTHNEEDPMHAVIEKESRVVVVYTPMQCYAVASSAKKNGGPVTEMEGHMNNFKALGDIYLSFANVAW